MFICVLVKKTNIDNTYSAISKRLTVSPINLDKILVVYVIVSVAGSSQLIVDKFGSTSDGRRVIDRYVGDQKYFG